MKRILVALCLHCSIGVAHESKSSLEAMNGDETLPPIDDAVHDKMPGDQVLPPLGQRDNRFQGVLSELQRTVQEEEAKLVLADSPNLPLPADPEEGLPRLQPEEAQRRMVPRASRAARPTYAYSAPLAAPREAPPEVFTISQPSGGSVTVFASNISSGEEDYVTLPSGSHAFARVKIGEQVTASGSEEIMAELDYAFLGPNGAVVEMRGCIVWIGVTSNFHTRRVKGSARDLTCTAPSGRVFTVHMTGPIVGVAKGYAGVESNLIMEGPAVAAVLEHLGNTVEVFGRATAAVETTTTGLAAENVSEKITNVTGDKRKYTAGKVLEANGEFLKYISSFFKSMEPTLAIESGKRIHIVNRHNIKIPKEFFVFRKEPAALKGGPQ